MKTSVEIRRNTGRMIAKNLIVLAAIAVAVAVGVIAWFTSHQTVTADGIEVQTVMADGLEYFIVAPNANDQYSNINTWISTYNSTHASESGFVAKDWHTGELNFDFSDAELKFMEDIFLCETTSDGKTFQIPKLIQYGDIAYVDTTEAFEEAVANNEYMSFDLYFRSKASGDVKLKNTSTIAPVGTISTSSEEEMKNAAIGAVRMSVLNGNTRELLWIPGPRVWFDGTANNNEGVLHTNYTGNNNTFKPGGNVTVSNNSITLTGDGTDEHWYYNSSKNREQATDGVVASTRGDYRLGNTSNDDISVVTLDNTNYDSTNDYYYNHIRINLWIEGEDAESRLKFVGGKFQMNLDFDLAASSGS